MTIAKFNSGLWFTIVFVFLVTSCDTNNTRAKVTTTSTTLMVTPASTESTSTLGVPTNTYTLVSATSTRTSPTLSAEEREHLITQLLTEDYQCMLPCWGEIEPGVTTWQDAKLLLEQFAQIYSSQSYIYTAEFQYSEKNVVLVFYVRNNIVEFIAAPRFEYPLHRLLQDYGEPDEVYFYILDVLPIDTNNPYTVYLFYKEKGIIAEYNGAAAKGATISVCFRDSQGQKSQTALLSLWSKGSDKTFENVIAQYMSSSLKYYKIEELSPNTSQEFYEIYQLKDSENYCLEIKNPNPKPE